MSERPFEDRPTSGTFPEAADDDYPERARVPEPEGPDFPSQDGYAGTSAFGTTASEEVEGESLDEKLSHELPEVQVDPAADRDPDASLDYDDELDGGTIGQLVSPDQGAGPDLEKDEVAVQLEAEGDEGPEAGALHLEREA